MKSKYEMFLSGEARHNGYYLRDILNKKGNDSWLLEGRHNYIGCLFSSTASGRSGGASAGIIPASSDAQLFSTHSEKEYRLYAETNGSTNIPLFNNIKKCTPFALQKNLQLMVNRANP